LNLGQPFAENFSENFSAHKKSPPIAGKNFLVFKYLA